MKTFKRNSAKVYKEAEVVSDSVINIYLHRWRPIIQVEFSSVFCIPLSIVATSLQSQYLYLIFCVENYYLSSQSKKKLNSITSPALI